MSEQHNVPPKIQKNTVPPYISPVVDVLTDKKLSTQLGYTVSVIQCTGPGVVGGHV